MNQDATPPITIRFVNVKKHFKDRDVEALGGIDLEVAQGEFVTLIGPSGSGKSTLLELLGDIGDEGGPTEGRILIDGKTPEQLRRERGYGIVFQESTLFLDRSSKMQSCLFRFQKVRSHMANK
jgi:NitT/TauT family transport system ATP-binding protein